MPIVQLVVVLLLVLILTKKAIHLPITMHLVLFQPTTRTFLALVVPSPMPIALDQQPDHHLQHKPATNRIQMPPPTPSQGFFQSSLFGGGTSSSHDESALARPSTSSGRKSMEAHVLVPQPLVTPATLNRPPLVQVHDLDPNNNNNSGSSLKKPNNFNPYANRCKKMMLVAWWY
jgi:hypothetical protein